MYCSYFGFTERPFTLTPNPAFIFLSRAHQEAFAHLIYGIENRCGFIMLTGEVGAGKTTVIRTLLTELKPETHATALILNPMVSADGLLRAILREFGIESADCNEPADMVEALNRFLLQQIAAERKVVLVIDEAQDMDPAVLEQVRLISNLETTTDKLIQIILVGQPELETVMSRTELRQLNQRITVRFHLTPMEQADTDAYLQHRIKTAAAGNAAAAVFTAAAVKRLHRFSGGLPRLINAAADRALLIAFNQGTREIDGTTARKAITDVTRSAKEQKSRYQTLIRAFVLIIAVTMLILGGWHLNRSASPPPASVPAASEQHLAAVAAAPESEHLQAVMVLLGTVWGTPIPASSTATSLEQALRQSGFASYTYTGNLGGLMRLGYPALLDCTLPGAPSKRFLLLVGTDQQQATIAGTGGQRLSLPISRLEQIWTGKAVIPWRNLYALPVPLRSEATAAQRQALVRLLAAASVWNPGDVDYSDGNLRAAVRRFQQQQGIEPTGTAGVLTMMHLYRLSPELPTPTMTRVEDKP